MQTDSRNAEKPILQHCFELLDQLSVSDGAITWVEHCLKDLVLLEAATRPLTPDQDRIEGLVMAWSLGWLGPETQGPAEGKRKGRG